MLFRAYPMLKPREAIAFKRPWLKRELRRKPARFQTSLESEVKPIRLRKDLIALIFRFPDLVLR